MDPFWSDYGAPDPRHFLVAVYSAFGFFGARLLLDSFVYRRLATWLSSDGQAPVRVSDAKHAKVVKCSESMWKLTYYAAAQAWVLTFAYHQPWFTDINEYFIGWPNQELQLTLKVFYMFQCGFYIYSTAALLIWETRRKDFFIMMSHHIVTVILISYSYITRFFRIGAVILALHDTSDVFMEAAKVFKYSEKEFAASVFFGFFAVSWLILRLIIFPFWVIWSSSYNTLKVLDVSVLYPRFIYYIFNTMLLTLLVFHIYWWILIYSMIMRQLQNKGKVGEDIRSDSEDEDS